MKLESVIIVSTHYNENLDWLRNQNKYAYVIYSKTDKSADKYIPRNVGREAESYLHYIIDNYDKLEETIVFIHGHEYAWHQNGSVLDILDNLENPISAYRYHNLNNRWFAMIYELEQHNNTDDVASAILNTQAQAQLDVLRVVKDDNPDKKGYIHHVEQFHKDLLDPILPLPPYQYSRVCAQFIIHKSLILKHDLSFWKGLLNKLYAYHDGGYGDLYISVLFEVLWFYIFTGEYDEKLYIERGRNLCRSSLDSINQPAPAPAPAPTSTSTL